MIQFMLFSWSLFHRKLINTQKLYPALCGVVNFQNYKKEITDTNIFFPLFLPNLWHVKKTLRIYGILQVSGSIDYFNHFCREWLHSLHFDKKLFSFTKINTALSLIQKIPKTWIPQKHVILSISKEKRKRKFWSKILSPGLEFFYFTLFDQKIF